LDTALAWSRAAGENLMAMHVLTKSDRYKRDEKAKERTRKNIEHTRVGVASINTEQDNSNNVQFFSRLFTY